MSRSAIVVSALLLSTSAVRAQTGTVRIRVTGPIGHSIPFASVSRVYPDNQPIETFVADDSGSIILAHVPAGFVRLLASAPGFSSRLLPLDVSAGEERTIEVKLDVGGERGRDVPTVSMPLPDTLDSSESVPAQPKPTKHHWWQIFQ